ncbi:MAG: PAS domain S-box protein [Desulfarculus sp.]|nr:PAS domain S-box protein [Desulfarculus sp.]
MDRHQLEKSLSWRRLVYMAFGAVVLLILLGGSYSLVVFRTLRDQAQRETLAADLALAELGSQFVADHQNGLLKRLQTISARNVLQKAVARDDLPEMRAFITSLFADTQEIESVFLANRQGGVRLMVPELSQEKDSHPGLTGDLGNLGPERTLVSGVHPGLRPPHLPVVTLAAGIPDADGGFLGYLGISQRVEFWQQVFERFSARPGRTFHLFDQRGQVVAQGLGQALDEPAALTELARQVRESLVHQAKSLTTVVGQPDTPGHSFAAAARVPSLDWILVVIHDYQAAMAPSRAMFGNILFFLVLLFLCLMLVGFLLMSRYRIQQRLLARVDGEARALERLVAERTADLVASTERYRSLVQDLPDMVYEMDAQGRLTFVSNASLAVLGYRPEEMIGRPRREYVVPEDRHKFDEERQRASEGEQMSNLELRHRAKDGSLRWLAIHSRGLFDRSGRLVGRRGVARDMSQQVLAERRVRELSHKLINAQEEERKRVALDLHDELGQLLSALKIGLQSLAQQRGGEEAGELQRLIRLSQKIMDRIRAMAYHLRPAILDNFGLLPALEDLCESLGESGLIQVETQLQEVDEKALSPEAKTALFRFVQESLTNAVKHSGSDRARVVLEQTGDGLLLTVTDQGSGFDVAAALGAGPENKHMGLLGMEERIRLIGGSLSIESSGRGTTLSARLPLGGKA